MIVTISDSDNDQKVDNVIFTNQFRTSEDIYGFIIIIYNLSSDSSLYGPKDHHTLQSFEINYW